MCLAAERIYVMDSIYDRFIERVVEEARALRQGDPLGGNGADIDVGAMTMPHQVDIVEHLVADAVQKGAKVLVGGERRPGGNFFQPTVLIDVDHSMAIMREETFGPVMAIMRAVSYTHLDVYKRQPRERLHQSAHESPPETPPHRIEPAGDGRDDRTRAPPR